MSTRELRQFLNFVTGSDRVPIKGSVVVNDNVNFQSFLHFFAAAAAAAAASDADITAAAFFSSLKHILLNTRSSIVVAKMAKFALLFGLRTPN
jgi:hypothetical protein